MFLKTTQRIDNIRVISSVIHRPLCQQQQQQQQQQSLIKSIHRLMFHKTPK